MGGGRAARMDHPTAPFGTKAVESSVRTFEKPSEKEAFLFREVKEHEEIDSIITKLLGIETGRGGAVTVDAPWNPNTSCCLVQ